jgi:subtilisin family serine protease
MKKSILAASAGVAALAGLAWAAAGGSGHGGGGFVLLPASSGAGATSGPQAIQPSPAADSGEFQLAADGKHIVDSYICVYRAGSVAPGQERAEANRSANAAGGSVTHVYVNTIRGFSVHASAQGVANMQAHNPRIDHCAQDQVATIIDPVDAQARPGGGGGSGAQQTPAGITRVGGGTTTASGTAWVIDTGIDLDHPDLNVDVARSRNFVQRETSPDDLNGHGSHVSGTIAARSSDNAGVVGVSPGTTLVAVRVLNRRGSGAYSDVIAGVDYVGGAGKAGDVANMSLGGPVSADLDNAVIAAAAKGVKFALAAGNESEDADLHSPGRAEGTNIWTVSAVNASDTWASFSNFGSHVDYAEPGVSILSTWKDGGYNTISGTSMATPHLAGVLLFGSPTTSGFAKGDPDGKPDPIGHK